MSDESIELIAKALSDKNRVAILKEIAKGQMINCKEAEGCTKLSQPTVSHHIKILVDAGLVNSKKDGRSLNLTVNKKELEKFSRFFDTIS